MEKKHVAWICAAVIIAAIIGYWFIPSNRAEWNTLFYNVQKADDATSYTTKKKVEDTCRSMIASYESDKLTYEQYKDSDSAERQSWAEQAKMRANKTASSYNNYILQNSFIWSDGVPNDIRKELDYIQ